MRSGLYARVWLEDGQEVRRYYAVRNGQATDIRKCRTYPLAHWAGQPGEWRYLGPDDKRTPMWVSRGL